MIKKEAQKNIIKEPIKTLKGMNDLIGDKYYQEVWEKVLMW